MKVKLKAEFGNNLLSFVPRKEGIDKGLNIFTGSYSVFIISYVKC